MFTARAQAPAEASSCPPPGGQSIGFPSASSKGEFVFRGRGFGHGVGMSQYGARGAAELGCTAKDIVTTYYAGTKVATADTSGPLRVGIIPNAPSTASSASYYVKPVANVNVRNVSNVAIPWTLVGGSTQPPSQPAGELWRAQVRDNGEYRLHRQTSGTWIEVWRGSSTSQLYAALGSSRVAELTNGVRYNRGRLEFQRQGSSGNYRLYVTARLRNVEEYLYGLAEMPSSWHVQALGAQATVGRSFALIRQNASGYASNCLCHIYDSVFHQVYRAANKELEGTNAQFGKRWVSAVDATKGQVIRRSSDNALLSGNYASSHGGHSESSQFVWGGAASHLQAIDDSQWERASANPYSQWTVRFTPEQLGSAFGVGVATEVRLPTPRGVSGRIGDPKYGAGGMVVEGTTGTVRVSGDRARTVLGLRSTNFRVVNPPGLHPDAIPVTGDWDGNGITNVGWFHNGVWRLRMTDGSTREFLYGREAGDIPVTGNWNGDEFDGVGVYRKGGEWHLRNSLESNKTGMTAYSFKYGVQPGDVPVTGDWTGNGTDGVGVFRKGGEWHLRNSLASAPSLTVHSFIYGTASGDVPVTGNWTGKSADGVGVFRKGGEWHLRNSLANQKGMTVHSFVYGKLSGDVPLTGDWDKDLRDGVGVFRQGGEWNLRNSLSGPGQTVETFKWH